jgi:glycosyltransferase involved in cell wall biosynthesis
MNILFINSLRPNRWGGGEKWMVEAAAGLQSMGHVCMIGALKNSVIAQKAALKNVSTIGFGVKSDFDVFAYFRLKKILVQHNIDILVCCQNKDVRIGGRAGRKVGLKGIFSRQGLQLITKKRRYKFPFTQLIDGIITNTETIRTEYERYGWFDNGFIHVIYNGMELPVLRPTHTKSSVFSFADERPVIFSAGRLSHQKGFNFLIDAARISLLEGYDWQFVIAGSGKLEKSLMTQARNAGVEKQIHFAGFISDLSPMYQAADVFALPSLFEGMPNVVMEAMAHGTATVATRVNGAAEIIENDKTGLLVDPGNAQQLYLAVKELVLDEDKRKELGKNARKHIETNFTTQLMCNQIEALFINQLQKKS